MAADDPIYWSWEARDPKRRSGWELLRGKMNQGTADRWAADREVEIRRVDGSSEDRRQDPPRPGRPGLRDVYAASMLEIPAYYWYRDRAGGPNAWHLIHVEEDSIAFMRGEMVTREDEREAILCGEIIGPVAISAPSF